MVKDTNYMVLTTRIIRARAAADKCSLQEATYRVSSECMTRSLEFKARAEQMEAAGEPAREVTLHYMEMATLSCIGVYATQILSAVHGIPW